MARLARSELRIPSLRDSPKRHPIGLFVVDLVTLYWIILLDRLLYRGIAITKAIDKNFVLPLFGYSHNGLVDYILQYTTNIRQQLAYMFGWENPFEGPRVYIPVWGKILKHRERISWIARPFLDTVWGLFHDIFGDQYVSVSTLRWVDHFLHVSFWLDLAELASSFVLLACLANEPRIRPLDNWRASQTQGNGTLFRKWKTAVAAVLLASLVSHYLTSIFIGLTVMWYLFIQPQLPRFHELVLIRTGSWTRALPRNLALQIGMSIYRLHKLDPYFHQIQTPSAIMELWFFYEMLQLAREATDYWHRCNIDYVDAIMKARYPDIYAFAVNERQQVERWRQLTREQAEREERILRELNQMRAARSWSPWLILPVNIMMLCVLVNIWPAFQLWLKSFREMTWG